MKKIILAAAAAAATLATAAPAAAQSHNRDGRPQVTRHVDRDVQVNRAVRTSRNVTVNRNVRVNRNVQVNRYAQQQRRWNRGERFDRRYATNYQVIQRHNRLYQAPRGYQWVRSGNDAVLVSIASGIIGALVAGLF